VTTSFEQNAIAKPQGQLDHLPVPVFGGTSLGPENVLFTDVEVGMPLTGLNNLAETPLLRLAGDLRWRHMSAVCGVQSKNVVDEKGDRLYPTFFYVEVAFPPDRPMATFGENDQFTIVCTLRRYGILMLDGEHFLFPRHWPENQKLPIALRGQRLTEVPFVRMSNIFVKQWKGAGWLKKSRPLHPGFQKFCEMQEPPDSYSDYMRIKEGAPFFDVADSFVPITPGEGVDVDYQVIPDRDLNGAGLIYFANYPTFLDIAERQMLANENDFGFVEELINRRTLLHRKTAYFSNATSNESLRINVKAWIESPFRTNTPDPALAPIRLVFQFEMHRRSDNRLMLRSSATKILFGHTFGDTNLLDRLKSTSKSVFVS
jgi:probable biosynthetic protein (TIGR04098 family)